MMRTRAFTFVELLVVISIVGLLVAILVPGLHRAREESERAACLENQRQLIFGWLAYAEDFDGRIVNGRCGVDREDEPAWVGNCWVDNYGSARLVSRVRQVQAIKKGALFPYLSDVDAYRCPAGGRGQMLTYAVLDGMNGVAREGTEASGVWIRDRHAIREPAERGVFIDDGWAVRGSFGVYFRRERWRRDPPVQHGDGTTLSFADGHADHWAWKGVDTIDLGRRREFGRPGEDHVPETIEGYEDLHRLQRATWGRLGYEPTEY